MARSATKDKEDLMGGGETTVKEPQKKNTNLFHSPILSITGSQEQSKKSWEMVVRSSLAILSSSFLSPTRSFSFAPP